MPDRLRLWAAGLAALALVGLGATARAAEPTVRPAADGIFAAFRTHPLVGFGEAHGLADEGDFYVRLVRDPRFAALVGNVVVESAGSAQQALLDRYIAGEDVPHDEVRKVWTEVVGWLPTVNEVMYPRLLAEIRAVNLTLPPSRRIKVWAGEPPIDWATLKSRAEFNALLGQRDSFPAGLIEREILAKGKKALVIYGGLHFFPPPAMPGRPQDLDLKSLVERDHPGAFFVIQPYRGFEQPACSASFEAQTHWPRDSLVTPVKGTPVEALLLRPGCAVGQPPTAPPGAPPIPAEVTARLTRLIAGVEADALLYIGPAAGLTNSENIADLLDDPAYVAEIKRHLALMGMPESMLDGLSRTRTPYRDPAPAPTAPPSPR